MLRYYIHVEKIWDNEVWNNLREFIKHHKCHLFLMPPQYFYQKAVLGYRGTEKELDKILKERYKQLYKWFNYNMYNSNMGVHVHFSLHPQELSEEYKSKTFDKYFDWFPNFVINNVSFGWFKSDQFLRNLCKKKNIKIKHYAPLTINLHDYDLPISKLKVFENFIKDNLRRLLR